MSPDRSKNSSALVKSEKKALKKHAPAKSHPKKSAKRHPVKQEKHGKAGKGGPGNGGKHLRRVYEHLARVRVLLGHIGGDARLRTVAERLTALVYEDIRAERAAPKSAAELARAAEHIAFAAFTAHDEKTLPWSPRIKDALHEEYRKLEDHVELSKAKSVRNERAEAIRTLCAMMAESAKAAWQAENHSRAMECMRAAESLAAAVEEAE